MELDHLAGLDVDQVIVVLFGRLLIARAAVAEIVAREDAGLLEQAHGPVDRGDGDVRIDGEMVMIMMIMMIMMMVKQILILVMMEKYLVVFLEMVGQFTQFVEKTIVKIVFRKIYSL